MEFTGFPRHQLRAMGRLKGRYSSRPYQTNSASTPHSVVRTSPTKPVGTGHTGERVRLAAVPECAQASVLLDYLSQAASDLGREVIEPEVLPAFAKNTMPSVIVPPQRQKTVKDEWSPNFSTQPPVQTPAQNRNFGLAESALQGLADLLTLEAGSIRESAESREPRENREQALASEFVQCARPPLELVAAPASSYEMLNSWLNTGRSSCATTEDDDDMLAFSLDEIETVSLYADDSSSASSASGKSVSQAETDCSEALQAQRLLGNMSNSVHNAESTDQLLSAPAQVDTHIGPALSRNQTESAPKLQLLSQGRRMESLDNGAQIIKDSLGRVIEVRSPLGPILRTRYDENGHLRFFVRTDKEGNIQSYGESDKQGVVVHDPEGRVRAAGESMAIDRVGRLSIVRKDGQFWSIDLARGLHVERRQMVDEDGQWKAITAVFAYDGFRMVTRFQSMDAREFNEEEGCYLLTSDSIIREEIRLYGRDGSCVQFDSEDAIEELRPSRVWPPGSRAVDKKYRNRWQAGTAWQAVREYLELLKSGSG
ncbi:MAG: hypothetical protein IT342_23875 [Candidatus Melainabacteria bacterium]|nr:hypothetical protein [Candidatus Melainabacteria bacterium]